MLFLRKRWLHLIDAVGLLAVVSAVVYVGFGARVASSESAVWSLWANFTTDLIVIWIGVRVIDTVARWSEALPEIRRMIRANLRYMAATAEDLTPRYYDWILSSLRREVDWFEQSIRENRARLSSLRTDEREVLLAAMDRGREAVAAARRYIQAREETSDSRALLEAQLERQSAEPGSGDQRHLRLYDFPLLVAAERKIELLGGRREYNEDEFVSVVDRAVAELKRAALPSNLVEPCALYTTSLRSLPRLRALADASIIEFANRVREVEDEMRRTDHE